MNIKSTLKNFWKKLYQTQAACNVISSLAFLYTKFVYKTTKWNVIGRENLINLWEKNQSFILVGWHGRALMYSAFRDYRFPLNALVSLHKDGRLIAGILQKYGLGTIGGSSNKNAAKAACALMNSLKKNVSICIIPDGPRGPRMIMTESPIYYAQKTGAPIIGITYSVKKCKFAKKSWDKMMIPYPFNEGVCRFTKPVYVPQDLSEKEFEQYRLDIENLLNNESFLADKEMGLDPILPDYDNKETKKGRKQC